ncbi:MAG: hypothetical protein ACK44E_10655, partial [Anaerolineales bacterium]
MNTDDVTAYYRLLEKTLNESIAPPFFYLFLWMAETLNYTLFSPNQPSSAEISFPENSPFIELLSKKGKAIALFADETLPKLSQNDRAKLSLLEMSVCYPLLSMNRLIGFIGLGKPLTAKTYSREDHHFMEEICRQSSLLIHHLLEKEAVRQQIHQMETLNRLAQGINVTLHFDDLLE